MPCPFLLRGDHAATHCEVLLDQGKQHLAEAPDWICLYEWARLCPHFAGLRESVEPPSYHGVKILHLNRIGGPPAINPDLL